MKTICFILFLLVFSQLFIFSQDLYVGVINYVQGDLIYKRQGNVGSVSRRMPVYSDSIIEYDSDYDKLDGLIQIVLWDNNSVLISSFPKEFKKTFVVIKRSNFYDLLDYIGANVKLSTKDEDILFKWYCNIKRLDYRFAKNFRIIISKNESSVVTDSINPLVFQLKEGISIKEIAGNVYKFDQSDTPKIMTEWTQKNNEWTLEFKNLPIEDEEVYVFETTFILNNGQKEIRKFHYQVFKENKMKEIEKEALSSLPAKSTQFKKRIAIIKKYEEYDLLLPAIRMRKQDGLIIKGLLGEVWYEDIE